MFADMASLKQKLISISIVPFYLLNHIVIFQNSCSTINSWQDLETFQKHFDQIADFLCLLRVMK